MTNGIKDVALVPARLDGGVLSMIERLAVVEGFDVTKLKELIDLQERILDRNAQAAFNASMTQAQMKMRPIAADAENPQTRSKYASYAQLDRALRPIYSECGFAVSFDTGDNPPEAHVRMLAYVTHVEGYARTYHADIPADGKGAKGGDVMTKTHATGAAMSYGMRYLLKMIFNVAVGEDDTDGNTPKETPSAPAGFAKAWEQLGDVVPEGIAAYHTAWKAWPEPFRLYAAEHLRVEHEARKVRAKQANQAVAK
jgi:hypothetical protein